MTLKNSRVKLEYMKKILIAVTLLTILFFPAFSVSAQTPTPSVTPKGQQVRQDVKARVAQKKVERAAALTEQRQLKIKTFFERMIKRFEAAIERLEKLIDRIETRMDKIKTEDPSVDLSDEEDQLNDAKEKLNDAKDKMQGLKDEFDTLLGSNEPKVIFKQVGKDLRDLKQDLVEVHRILVHIIGDIKGLRVGQGSPKPTATP